MRTASLTGRLVATVLVLELLCAMGLSGAGLWNERRARLRAFDVMLQGRSDSLLGAIQDAEDPADNVHIDPSELRVPDGDQYAVYNRGGRLLGQSEDAPAQVLQREGDGFRTIRSGGRRFRVLEREGLRIIDRDETGGVGLRRPVTIVYAAPINHLWHESMEAAGFNLLVTVLLVCATTIVLVYFVNRLLRPIQDLAAAAGDVSPATLNFSPPQKTLEIKELRPLAVALSATMDRLRHAFEAEQRFVGDAAHELKTAVAVVRSSIQVLNLRRRSVDEYQAGLDGILTDNERVEELVSRMLSSVRQSTPQHTRQPVNVSESVSGTLQRLRSYGEARGVRLESQIAPDIFAPIGDEEIQTLVSNLVVNAVQHSEQGSAVAIVLDRRHGAQQEIVLEVRDRGAGIAEASLPYVFERFYREDASRSRETGGAGLGLAICKGIVEAAGGEIQLESVQGQGTTVRACFSLV